MGIKQSGTEASREQPDGRSRTANRHLRTARKDGATERETRCHLPNAHLSVVYPYQTSLLDIFTDKEGRGVSVTPHTLHILLKLRVYTILSYRVSMRCVVDRLMVRRTQLQTAQSTSATLNETGKGVSYRSPGKRIAGHPPT